MGSRSLAYMVVCVSFHPAAAMDFGKEIVNPFAQMADLEKAHFVERILVGRVGQMTAAEGNKRFAVGKRTNHNFVVVFDTDRADFVLSADDSIADHLDLGASFARVSIINVVG